MVNLSPFRLVSMTQSMLMPRHPQNVTIDRYWRKRTVLKLAAHFYGRSRNCFSIAIRRVQRSLQNVTAGRYLRKFHTVRLWNSRIEAGAGELGHFRGSPQDFVDNLRRSDIFLDRKTLSNLAIWEPRTFKSIDKVVATKAKLEGEKKFELGPPPQGIYTRGKL